MNEDDIIIATKFAAYPWRLTPAQFVNACKYAPLYSLSKTLNPDKLLHLNFVLLCHRSSLDRLQIKKIGIGQLHWSTAKYAPLQESALWDGLVAMHDKVNNLNVPLIMLHFSLIS